MPNMSDIEMVSNPLHRDVLSTESGHENRTYAAKETNDHQGGSMRPQFVKQKSILDCGFLDFLLAYRARPGHVIALRCRDSSGNVIDAGHGALV